MCCAERERERERERCKMQRERCKMRRERMQDAKREQYRDFFGTTSPETKNDLLLLWDSICIPPRAYSLHMRFY